MDKLYSTRVKYNRLFYNLLILVITTPFVQFFDNFDIWFPIIFFSTIIFAINTLSVSKNFIYFCRGIATLSYLAYIVNRFELAKQTDAIEIFADSLGALFLILSIIAMTVRIVSKSEINDDVVKGSICIYLMIGILWSILYKILFNLDNNAFNLSELIYANSRYQLF